MMSRPALASMAAIAFALPASPSAPREAIRLEYRASHPCPDRSAFIAEVRSRTDRLREAAPGESARALVVTLEALPAETSGRLSTAEMDGAQSERAIRGATCADVASALALIVALAIDPEASTAPRPTPPLPQPLREVAPARPTSPVSVGTAWQFGALASLRSAIAPDLMPALGGYVKLEAGHAGPSAQLGVEHGRRTARVAEGGGEIAWTAAQLDGCPLGLALAERIALWPCVAIEAGALSVSGIDTPNPESVLRPWLALGPLMRLGFRPFPWLAIEPAAGVKFPLFRGRYYLRPSTTVHEVPLVEFHAGVALGVRLE
jgi:hypothetical protein